MYFTPEKTPVLVNITDSHAKAALKVGSQDLHSFGPNHLSARLFRWEVFCCDTRKLVTV